MSPAEHERIQLEGANARAINGPLSSLRCPYYESAKMPAATGESVEAWQAKAEAWQLGWQMEDSIRESHSASAPHE